MKKSLLLVVALLTTFAVKAQQIAVVSSDGNTTLYQDLNEAITDASSGSVIYLPGGGFQLKDEDHQEPHHHGRQPPRGCR